MPLPNQHPCMMDRLRQAELVDASLQTTLQEIFGLEGEHVIELHAGFIEHADADETADEGVAFEETLGVFFVEGEQLSFISLVLCRLPQYHRSYRAARRILDRVNCTRQTSRLLRRPYSPTSLSSESLRQC